jgi:alpha-1,6-mannosyltransferase
MRAEPFQILLPSFWVLTWIVLSLQIIVIFAFGYFIRNRIQPCLSLLTFACTIFRSELLALIAPLLLITLFRKLIPFYKLVELGIFTGIFSLGQFFNLTILNSPTVITITVDSIMWKKFLWPEVTSKLISTLS